MPVLRRVAAAAAGLVLLAALASGLFLVWLDSRSGHEWLLSRLNRSLAAAGIALEGLGGSLWNRPRLAALHYSDAEGLVLTLADIVVAWRPGALLRGRLWIDRLTVARGRLLRPPAAAAPQAGAGPSGSATPLPPEIVIANFALPDFAVAPAAFGVPATLAATGHLQMVPGQRIRAKLDIRRRDAADLDQLSLALDYRAGGATLALSSSLAGKAGGLLAAIFGARPEEDIAIEVAGSGPLARWRGTLSGHVGSAARASARIESTGDRVEMAGRIELDEARLPAPLGAILGSGGEFRLGAGAARDGRIALSARADLDRGTYHLDGNIAPEGATRLDLALSANLAEATPLTHALAMPDAFAAATITGHLRGTLLEPAFAGRLTIRQPRGAQGLRAAELDNVLSLRLAPETLAFRITGQAMDLVLQQRPMGTFDYAASGTIARADGQIGVSEFRIAGPPVSATGNATVRPRDGGWRLKATIEVPDPAALLPDLRLGGRLAGTIELVQEGARAPLSGTAAFRATGFQSGDGAIDRLLARAPRLGVRFVRVPGGALRLSALHLAGSHATLDAAGDIDPAGATLSMRYRLAIHDIGTLAGPGRLALEGAATIEGRLEGPLAAPKVDFEARLPRLDLARIVLRDLDLAGVLTDPFGTPAARIRLTAASDAGPVVAETLAKTTGPGALAFEDVRLDIGGVRLAGQLLRDAKGLLRGRLSSPSVMPERLVAGLGEGLEGALGVAIDLAAPEGVQEIRATVDGSGLRLRAGPDAALAIGSLSLAARARFGPERPAIEARLEIAALEAGLARIDAIGITAHAGKAPLRLEARARGQWRGELALDAALALDDAATHMSARLDLAGTLFGSPLAVGEPLRLETAPGEWRIEAPDIRLGAGRIALTATHEAGTRRLRFTLAGLPLALLNRFSERPLPRGTVDAALDLRQQGGDSRGTIHLAIRGMRPWSEPLRPLPPVDLVIAAEIAGGLLSLDARTTAADALSGAARVALPVAIDLARARLSLDRAAPLRGHVSWRGALAPAFALSGMPALAAGRLDIDADLAGTLMAPRLEGRLRLDDGRFEHVASGFVASDIRLAALLAGRHLEVTELSAGDGNGGTIAGTGSLAWSPAGGLDADIALRLAHARILRRPGLAAQVSGDLRVTSDPDGVRLSGQVAAERVDLDLKQRSSDEIVTIAVTEINGGPTTTARAGGTAQRPRPLLLDLALDAPRHLFVRGRGIDSEWSARLTASGPADRPRIGGTASLVRGSFDFLGRRFDFDEGSLVFAGDERLDPLAHLVAREMAEGLAVTLTVDGPLSHPDIRLSSSPALPEDEIVARLLFGASVSSLTPVEALQLASALAGLAGGSTFDIVGNTRSLLGLDRLSLAPGDETTAAPRITGGKYLSDKVYLEIATDTGTGTSEGRLEWSLTRHLGLSARVRSDQESAVRLRWSWSY